MVATKAKRLVNAVCKRLGKTRQAWYKAQKARKRQEVNEAPILEVVREEREVNLMTGTKKVLAAIRPELRKAGFDIGRNRLGEFLKRNGMLVDRRNSFKCRTTRQDPSLVPAPNLVKDMEVTAPNQALCADITYICTDEGFPFLSLVMDMLVREIVGFAVKETLEAQGPLEALKMASGTMRGVRGVVAHSDRGCQYASRACREFAKSLGRELSMTEELHCYGNAMAERLNGILKGENFLGRRFKTKAEAIAAIKEAIRIYNTRRLHEKLGYKTPSQFRAEWQKEVA